MSKLLEALTLVSNSNAFLFVCFHDIKKDMPARQFYGTFEEHKESLKKWNENGYGVYVTINTLAGSKRTNKDVIRARALFIDDDKGYNGDYPLPPSLVVKTSIFNESKNPGIKPRGKLQKYWFIKDSPSIEEWARVQKKMVDYGCDPSVIDPARVLRVPGFYNNKASESNNGEPFLVTENQTIFPKPQVFEWEKLKAAFYSKEKQAKEDPKAQSSVRQKPYEEAISDIIKGINYNNSLCSLSMHFANIGLSEQVIVMTLQGIMQQAEVKDERWQQRYDHIPVYAKSAVEKSSFDDEELDVDYEYPDVNEERTDNFPWPPGYLGELALSVKHFQHFKNDTLAVITALGVVAGVSGRQFNISNTGLNLYLTILMDSGMGKDSVQKYITKFLIEFNELGNALSFLGPKRYTGPKALYAALKKQRCLVSVLTEAAFILNASSGDQEGLTRAMLDLYTKSGHGDYVAGEAYSKEDESVEAMHSPSFSVISESTAEVYIEVLKTRQSAETGELGRMIVHYLGGKKPYLNRNQKFEISQNLREHFKSLLNSCILSVTQETNKVTPIAIPDAYWDFADWCVDMEMEHKHSNRVYSMSFSRMAIKALKLAALCAIMNPDTQRGEVSCTDWEWAVSACKFEASRLANLFHSTGSSDLDDLVATVVKPAIIKIISRTPKHENQKIPRGLSEKGVFTYSPLHQLTRASEPLKRLQNVRAGLSPLQMVLTHMVNIGLLRKIENPMEANRLNIETSGRKADKRAVFYQLTRETIELWSLQTKPKAVNPG